MDTIFKVSTILQLNMKLGIIVDEISERTVIRTLPYKIEKMLKNYSPALSYYQGKCSILNWACHPINQLQQSVN